MGYNSSRQVLPRGGRGFRVREAAVPRVAPLAREDAGWRPISRDQHRDLSLPVLSQAQKLSVKMWSETRIGNRLIELPIAFLLAEGVNLRVEDAVGQGWLTEFWRDPINRMGLRLELLMRDMSLYGHQAWPVSVREHDGLVRLGHIDPLLISEIIISPEQGEMPIVVVASNRTGGTSHYRVIYGGDEDDLFPDGTQARAIRDAAQAGDCMYFRINALLNGSSRPPCGGVD